MAIGKRGEKQITLHTEQLHIFHVNGCSCENANKLNRFSLTIDIIIAANATEEIEDECFRGPAKQLKDLVEDPLVRCYINLLMI